MRGGKRRRGLCRGCLVGSSEAPTRCPTAFVWYFINTSANYFPFFTGQFRSGIGECTLQARSVRPPLAPLSVRFSSSWPPKIRAYKPANVRKYTRMRVRTDTHARNTHARGRVSAYSRPSLAARKRKGKKGRGDGRSSVQICERYHVGRNAEIASRCPCGSTATPVCLAIDAPDNDRKMTRCLFSDTKVRLKSRRLSRTHV